MVVNVLVGYGYQRRRGAGGVPVLAGNRSRRVGEIVGGADGYTFCFFGRFPHGRMWARLSIHTAQALAAALALAHFLAGIHCNPLREASFGEMVWVNIILFESRNA